MLLWIAALFVVTSIATGIAPSFTLFVVARFVGGLTVGGMSVLSPMYVSEISPPAVRGRMGAMYQMSIVVGILISYLINYWLRNLGPLNWRWMFMSGAIPSIVFFAALLGAPETPRFLYQIGTKEEGLRLLSRLVGPAEANTEAAEIEASLGASFASESLFQTKGLRRALLVGFVLAILIHVSGINTIIDYSPIIFRSAGWKIDAALISTFVIGGINCLFTLVSFWTIDRYGRRPLYIAGSLGMALSLLGLAAAGASGFQGGWVLALIGPSSRALHPALGRCFGLWFRRFSPIAFEAKPWLFPFLRSGSRTR